MISAEIRQSFLDFFKSKGHTIVPSSSLMPDSPNLLFTNAGMNQFVPIFLGQRAPDVTKWAGAISNKDTRAADTQKCIRAGGKHNDLEDVGLDTYHHTFFEMLGNWSFGDYFKKEAIEWAWELVTVVWKFPKNRLYATVYSPDKAKGDPSEFDQEAYDYWAEKFRAAGLDPKIHIVNGNKKDNFWMMGDTGPCGPCSEIHVDLTPQGDTKGLLVNKGDARCIEIWNLVFIQFNANPDGSFSPLPAKHVDTGMGFERVTGIIQNTKNFTDFNRVISNYETDIFRPIFDQIEKLSGKKYGSTLPSEGRSMQGADLIAFARNPQLEIDIAFRVIADHIRTLSFAIADGIQPGNNDRNYVLRRILRRAVRYGRTLGFHEPFFYKLVSVLAGTMGHVFPEIRAKQDYIEQAIQREEEAFNRTLDIGIRKFAEHADAAVQVREWQAESENKAAEALSELKAIERELQESLKDVKPWNMPDPSAPGPLGPRLAKAAITMVEALKGIPGPDVDARDFNNTELSLREFAKPISFFFNQWQLGAFRRYSMSEFQTVYEQLTGLAHALSQIRSTAPRIRASQAFELYDTYGFPLDLTELMARERGLAVDVAGFDKLMDEQKARARAAQRREVIEVSKLNINEPTIFVGYDALRISTQTVGIVVVPERGSERRSVATVSTPFYAEMGGQVGDTGTITGGGRTWQVVNTLRAGPAFCHLLSDADQSQDLLTNVGEEVELAVDLRRRSAIQRHHTVTHLLHWALHEVVSKDASQKGSYVGPDKLTFDFSSAALSAQQIADVERLVNERILENAPVAWTEVKYCDIKNRPDIMQFFGEKYGDVVRVVQIGGKPAALDGYSMELCGGTHTRATGEIGLFRIVAESAIAAGIRRIEAVSGLEAYKRANDELLLIKTLSGKVNTPVGELEKKIESLLAQQKELEKELKTLHQKEATDIARGLVAKAQTLGSMAAVVENLGAADGDFLQAVADGLKGQFKGVVVLGGAANGAVALVATVSPDLTKKIQAGKIIQAIAPIVGGKGGGRPDNARGGGKDVSKLDEALAKATELVKQVG